MPKERRSRSLPVSPPTAPGGHPGDGPQPGSLDGAHRSGRAGGNHQDPPAAVLLPRRTPHPLGAPPHFASAPALALGSRVQWRPGTIARPAISCLTAARLPLTRHPANCTSPPTRANPVREGHSLPTAYRIMSAIATAGRHQRVWVPTSRRPHPHLLESGLAPSPSLTHHPWCQRQCPSLRWIRA